MPRRIGMERIDLERPSDVEAKGHTAVIYFHGIGTPERNESLSGFLDYFDLFGQTQSKLDIGQPRDFTYSRELFDDETISYVEFKRITKIKKKPKVNRKIRIYEAYWAPESSPRFGFWYFLLWISARIYRSIEIFVSPWRSFPSLKTYQLHRLAEGKPPRPYQQLEFLFKQFETWQSRTKYPRGRFQDFVSLILESKRPRAAELVELARKWQRRNAIESLKAAAFFAFLSASILGAFAILAISLTRVASSLFAGPMPSHVDMGSSLILLSGIVATPVTIKIFRRHVQDVLGWTIDSEKDRRFVDRRRVVRYSQNLIRHVTDNPECNRCIIVSHSLGTSIALEALLNEGVRQSLGGDLAPGKSIAKVSYVFTVGSPVDLIFYLFQTDRRASHRHTRLEEERRQSVGLPPFRIDGKAGPTRIINYWSRFDPLTEGLFSPRKSFGENARSIVNVEVLTAGMPFAAHTNYYADCAVMRDIYTTIMTGSRPSSEGNIVGNVPSRSMLAGIAAGIVVFVQACAIALVTGFASPELPIALAAAGTGLATWCVLWRRGLNHRYSKANGMFLRR